MLYIRVIPPALQKRAVYGFQASSGGTSLVTPLHHFQVTLHTGIMVLCTNIGLILTAELTILSLFFFFFFPLQGYTPRAS